MQFLLSQDPEEFSKRLMRLHRILEEEGFKDTPLLVSEFSTNIIYQNHINDSLYLAVFLLKNLLSCRKHCISMGYWLASDAALEYRENDDFLFGGNGLLSRHGLRKPGFFAYSWLNHMDHRLIGEGEHFLLTHGDGEYKLLLFHYTHFTPEYCAHSDELNQLRFPDGAFLDSPPQELHITLQNLPKGRYRVTRMHLSTDHGSLFHEWARLHFPHELSQYESNHLYETCSPRMSMELTEETDRVVITERLLRHNVVFYLIRRTL